MSREPSSERHSQADIESAAEIFPGHELAQVIRIHMPLRVVQVDQVGIQRLRRANVVAQAGNRSVDILPLSQRTEG
jgi:hypothetical protein